MTDSQQASLEFVSPGPEGDSSFTLLSLMKPLVFFDLETTGLDLQHDRIVQFAFIKIHPDGREEEWESLVNPGIPIPGEASHIHGITDRKVKDIPGFGHFAPRIAGYLSGCDLGGFNAIRFDVPMLQAEMTRHDHPLKLEKVKLVDPQVIFHKREPRDLAAACRFYCSRTLEGAHDALADIRATLDVFKAQVARYGDLPRDMEGLHDYCNEKDDRFVTGDRRLYWRNNEAVLAFGKHKSRSLKWLRENDPNYLFWIVNGEFSDETKDIVRKAINGVYPEKPKDDS
ncbi:MAG TPA: 3'-5' exonuclease [bacterium]|nr:3'-5' exonuclease [bacterium]